MIPVDDIKVSAYSIPTDAPEADGTLEWSQTTMIIVTLSGGGKHGIGYTYADVAAAYFIQHTLRALVIGKDLMQIPAITQLMIRAIRNNGACGIAMMAVSAIDIALWDLKAKILNLPLCQLLGKARDDVLIYGSGGFTSYSERQLQEQLSRWMDKGLQYVKIKIGAHPEHDIQRIRTAREIIGAKAGLFVDANGAFTVKQAIDMSDQFSTYHVSWFEEPVVSENVNGLAFIRDHVSATVNIAAGEYGYHLPYFQHMLSHEAVDVLQADATRCGGITGFMKAGFLCEAHQLPFSSHCAPALHFHAALALPSFYIAEYFHDHARIEAMFFDGIVTPANGLMTPDLSKTGSGLEIKYRDTEKYKIL